MFTRKMPWLVMLLLWMGGSTWWHVCGIKQLCADLFPGVMGPVLPVSKPPLTITDGERLNWRVPGNFSFAKSGDVPAETAVGNTLPTLATYLKANPGRQLTISGYYQPDEAYTGDHSNLGVARAEAIRQRLVALGVPAARLATKGELVGEKACMSYSARRDSLYGGLVFTFSKMGPYEASADSTATATTERDLTITPTKTNTKKPSEDNPPSTPRALAKTQKFTSVFKPLDLYFDTGQADYIATDDTRQFFEEAKTYLNAHKQKKLVLRGYTDNQGTGPANIKLARNRANGIKEQLVRRGIRANQIRVMAKGAMEPKASNKTEAGRRANRRVSVVVQ